MRTVLEVLAQDLEEREARSSFANVSSTAPLQWRKRGLRVGKTLGGARVRSSWSSTQCAHGCCFALREATLVGATLAESFTPGRPRRLIGDRAFDSDPLDERLSHLGLKRMAPHKSNRRKPPTQEGRPLRRYKQRWKIERLFAWLNQYNRILTRGNKSIHHYNNFIYLAFILILHKYL